MSTSDLRAYYRAVAPFYQREMRLRSDLREWRALARSLRATRVLDLGSGGGRAGRAIRGELPGAFVVGLDLSLALLEGGAAGHGTAGLRHGRSRVPFVLGDMRALPFRGAAFDLVVAANDPFAHLLDDEERVAAVQQAVGALAPGGRLVVDGLWLSAHDRRLAGDGRLLRERGLGEGIVLRERWRALGGSVFDTAYEYRRDARSVGEARAQVRAWDPREPALRELGGRVFGSLDQRPFLESGDRLVSIFEARPKEEATA